MQNESSNLVLREDQIQHISAQLKTTDEALRALLVDPISDLTRKRQERLLIVSLGTMLLSLGALKMVQAKFLGLEMTVIYGWQIIVAAITANLYFCASFLASYFRDEHLRELGKTLPSLTLIGALQELTAQSTFRRDRIIQEEEKFRQSLKEKRDRLSKLRQQSAEIHRSRHALPNRDLHPDAIAVIEKGMNIRIEEIDGEVAALASDISALEQRQTSSAQANDGESTPDGILLTQIESIAKYLAAYDLNWRVVELIFPVLVSGLALIGCILTLTKF